jgi:hypothetical protein
MTNHLFGVLEELKQEPELRLSLIFQRILVSAKAFIHHFRCL